MMVDLVKNSNKKPIEPKTGRKAIGDIVIAIRKDLINKKTKLKPEDFTYTDVY